MTKNYAAAAMLSIAACFNAYADNLEKGEPVPERCAEERPQVHIRDAKTIDHRYELKVSLPKSYCHDAQRQYPVVYILDGQWNFYLASSVYGSLAYDGQVPEAILVSITAYEPGAELHASRERDFLPVEQGKADGAGRFLSVLETELVRFIDTTYRSSDHRVLSGHSLSGTFVAFALFEKPALLLVAAPFSSLEGFIAEKVSGVEAGNAFSGKRFYIGKGALDLEKPGDDWLGERLRSETPDGSDFRSEMIDSVGHSGVNALTMTFGFQHVFRRPRLDLDRWIPAFAGDGQGRGTRARAATERPSPAGFGNAKCESCTRIDPRAFA